MSTRDEVEIANFMFLHGMKYKYKNFLDSESYIPQLLYSKFEFKIQDDCFIVFYFPVTEEFQNSTESNFSKSKLLEIKSLYNEVLSKANKKNKIVIPLFAAAGPESAPPVWILENHTAIQNHPLQKCSYKTLLETLVKTESQFYLHDFLDEVKGYISLAKNQRISIQELKKKLEYEPDKKTRRFGEIVSTIWENYTALLGKNNADFEDLINHACDFLISAPCSRESLAAFNFDYIIVDEFQDINRSRIALLQALLRDSHTVLNVVGDDYQSIYRFCGSEIDFFTNFSNFFGYTRRICINKTYRYSQELADISGGFIQKNKDQITKDLKSDKNIEYPVIVKTFYDSNDLEDQKMLRISQLREIFSNIRISGDYNPPKNHVLLLGRYKRDIEGYIQFGFLSYGIDKTHLKCSEFPELDIRFLTVHSSKGLSTDVCVILNGECGRHGFPSEVEDDAVMTPVMIPHNDDPIPWAEERRLFYVALTRCKQRTYILSPANSCSEFVLELLRDNDEKHVYCWGPRPG